MDAALATRDSALAQATAALAESAAELALCRTRIAQLEVVCDSLSDRVVGRERELEHVRAELERLHQEDSRGMQVLMALSEELEGVRRQARGQATRMRLRALRDAAELSERITELSRRPAEARDRLLDSLHEAIARIAEADAEPEELEAAPGAQVLCSAADLFEGLVEVEVGPLGDFSQLVGFEDAAGAIAATSEISVKRFARGRATLEMKLAEPVELLRELEQRTPFEFTVRDRRFDRLVLDVDTEAAEAA